LTNNSLTSWRVEWRRWPTNRWHLGKWNDDVDQQFIDALESGMKTLTNNSWHLGEWNEDVDQQFIDILESGMKTLTTNSLTFWRVEWRRWPTIHWLLGEWNEDVDHQFIDFLESGMKTLTTNSLTSWRVEWRVDVKIWLGMGNRFVLPCPTPTQHEGFLEMKKRVFFWG
jgi:hypothetical protein